MLFFGIFAGYSFLVIPLLVFLVLLTNKLDGSIRVSYFSACAPLFLTFFTLTITSFGSRGGNLYWFGLRKPPFQFLFHVCPCLQLFGNISYSLHSDNGSGGSHRSSPTNSAAADGHSSSDEVSSVVLDMISSSSPLSNIDGDAIDGRAGGGGGRGSGGMSKMGFVLGGKRNKKQEQKLVVPAMALEMPD